MSGPHQAVAGQRSAVRDELADLPPGTTVLVACSGGADSLALAAATAFVAARSGLHGGAVVVDHGLQPGSDAVAERAAQQCRDLGLAPVEIAGVRVPGGTGGPEAAARSARYAALEEAAERLGASAVLLGHTLDDQAETVLLGLARGSGARSLAGMPRRRGVLRRPFLAVRRAGTEQACAALGLTPWHDPTNGPTNGPGGGPVGGELPLRSRVRHDVLPVLEAVAGPGVAEALARTADQLREDAEVLDTLAAELVRAATVDGPGFELDVATLAAAPTAVRRRAVRTALLAAGSGAVHRVHVEAVDALVVGWHGQGPAALPGGARVVRRCGRLAFLDSGERERAHGGSFGHG